MNVIFNEEFLYKDLLQQYEKKRNNYVVLDEILKDEVLVVPYAPQQQQQQKIQQTPINVRWSTRLSRSLERYSPSLYYILLTYASEPECYYEVVQVDMML